MGIDWIGVAQVKGLVVGPYEHSNKPSTSIETGNVLAN